MKRSPGPDDITTEMLVAAGDIGITELTIYLSHFMDATVAEIWNIIKLSPVKSCELDPLPT